MNRQQQAEIKGHSTYLNDKPITDNPYLSLGSRYVVLSGFFEKGWLQAEKNRKGRHG